MAAPLKRINEALHRLNRDRLERRHARRAARADDRHPLAVMVQMKNEARVVDEWIDHYLWQGAEHVFVIDNASTDATVDRVLPWVERGVATLVSMPEPYRQKRHYGRVFRQYAIRSRFRWLIAADADEFWFVKDGRRLAEVLDADFEGTDVIYCNWRVFGCGGRVAHPTSLRRELVLSDPVPAAHVSTKWAVRTDAVRNVRQLGIHKVSGASSSRTLSANETFQINHYMTQSEEFWRSVKMDRGDACGADKDAYRDMALFREVDGRCTQTDRRLADLVAEADPIRLRA